MATTSDLVTPVSGTNSIDALMDAGPFWNFLTPQRSILYYCFATGDVAGGSGYTERPFSADQIANAKLAMAEAARVTGIRFCEVTDQSQADITFANTDISGAGVTGLCWWTYGYSYNPATTVLTSFSAEAFVYMDDTDYNYTAQTAPGQYGFEILLHEIGHALGLKHPFEGSPTLPAAQDNTSYTLMSYTHVGGNHSQYQSYDVAALQYVYGADGLGGLTGLGATGNNDIIGGDPDDDVDGTASAERMYGNGGSDILRGLAGNDTLDGGDGDDTLLGGAGADSLVGGAGADTASYAGATAGVTARLGGGTNAGEALGDTFSGVENLLGGDFADSLYGTTGANRLTGGAGNDLLSGLGGADTLDGGAGNDWFVASAGAESFLGGAGTDTVAYGSATAGVTARLGGGTNAGWALGDTFSGVENLTGSNYADSLYGTTGANRLSGGYGNDLLSGLGGADTLDGGDGNDWFVANAGAESFLGGAGTDTVAYGSATAGVTAYLGGGTNAGWALGDTFSGVENLTGSNYADSLYGTTGANRLTGGAGNDLLSGLGGADTLDGGDGNDWFVANAGAESFLGGAGTDTVAYGSATAGVTAYLAGGTNAGWALGDTFSGVENLTGSNYADSLYGTTGANRLSGGYGNDLLSGLGGADTLDGGGGNDWFVANAGAESFLGGAGTDTVAYGSATAGVTASLAGGAGTGWALGDTFSGVENLTGSSYADTLSGDGLANVLNGGYGNDLLFGGAGNDTLSGGAGANMFVAGAGNDSLSLAGASEFAYGGAGADTLTSTGGGKAVLAGGAGNDTLNTGSGAKVILYNAGDGADVVTCTGSTLDDTLSLGHGITAASLAFAKSGNNLVLTAGTGNSITFSNWYAATAQKSILTLQLIEEAAADFNPASNNDMLANKVLLFSFSGLVDDFDAARGANPALTSWALSNTLASELRGLSNTLAVGGDFAHEYGLHASFAAIGSTGAQASQSAGAYCTGFQALLAAGILGSGTSLAG